MCEPPSTRDDQVHVDVAVKDHANVNVNADVYDSIPARAEVLRDEMSPQTLVRGKILRGEQLAGKSAGKS